MVTATEQRIAVLEAQLKALTALTLSFIVASDIHVPGIQDSTVRLAQEDAGKAAERGSQLAFAFLGDLIDDLRASSGDLGG